MTVAILTAVAIILLVRAIAPLVIRAAQKRHGTFLVVIASVTAVVGVGVGEFLISTYGITAWLIQLGILLTLTILIRVVAKRVYSKKSRDS